MTPRRNLVAAMVVTFFPVLGLVGCAAPEPPATPTSKVPPASAAARAGIPDAVRVCLDVRGTRAAFRGRRGPLGHEVDVARAITDALGERARIIVSPVPAALVKIANGECDVAMGLIGSASIRREYELVDYMLMGYSWLVPKASGINGQEALENRKVGVVLGSYVADGIPPHGADVDEVEFESLAPAQRALDGGDVDTLLIESSSATKLVMDSKLAYRLVGTPVAQLPVGVVVSPSRPDLHDAVTEAVDELLEDGEINRILASWSASGRALA